MENNMSETVLVPMTEQAIAPNNNRTVATNSSSPYLQFTPEQKALIKKTVMVVATKNKDPRAQITDDELALFLAHCKRTGLDPFTKQIYGMKRWDKEADEYKLSIQTGIDGFRLIALRNPAYDGQSAPQWCGSDGKWKDIWLESEPPAAARVFVYRKGIARAFPGLAFWRESAGINRFWRERGASQLAKCAEVNGYRRAFPQDFSGIYIPEEMPESPNGPQISEDINASSPNPEPTPLSLPESSQNNTSLVTVANNPNEDDYEHRERQRLLNEIIEYMKQKKINPQTVKEIAKTYGIANDSLHMTSKELSQILKDLKNAQEWFEKHPGEGPESPPLPEERTGKDDPTVVITSDQTVSAPAPEQPNPPTPPIEQPLPDEPAKKK